MAAAWARRERMRSDAHVSAMLAETARAVAGLEDAVRRTEMPEQARAELAAQPLGAIDALIAQAPGNGAAHAWRAQVLALLGEEEGAAVAFADAFLRTPDDPTVLYLRGSWRLRRYAASRGLPAARGQDPRRRLADAAVEAGEDARAGYRSAIADYDAALVRSPENAVALFARGVARIELAQQEETLKGDPTALVAEAEADFRRAFARGAAPALKNLAMLHARAGRFDEAREEFERCVREFPTLAESARWWLREVERLREARASPWEADWREAGRLQKAGELDAARRGLERGFAVLEQSEAGWTEEERTRRHASERLRVLRAGALYNLGCLEALAGRPDRAFPTLEEAFRWSGFERAEVENDSDLAGLHADPRWPALLEKLR